MRFPRLLPLLTFGLLYAWSPLACELCAQGFQDGRQLSFETKFSRIRILETPRGQVVNNRFFEALRREIEEAAADGDIALIIDIHSGGGEVPAAEAISDLIRQYREHESMRILAYVGPRNEAISAAAWIAMSCRGLFIAPDAVIGDIQPLVGSFRGYENVPEKIVTKLSEDVWLSARENGLEDTYPAMFVRAMVDKDLNIYAVRNPTLGTETFMRAREYEAIPARRQEGLVVEEVTQPGLAFTTNGQDMLRWGFRVRTIKNRAEIVDYLGTADADVEVRKLKVRSPFSFEFDWAWILLAIGFLLLFAEFQAPGLGIFGVLGVAVMIGFFIAQFGLTGGAMLPIALLLLGVMLILVELVLLPGFLAPGLSGLALVLYATYIGIAHPESGTLFPWPDFDDEESRLGLKVWAGTLSASVVSAFVISFFFSKFLHRIPWLGKVIIVPPANVAGALDGAVTPTDRVAVNLGDRGEAITDLRPSGSAKIAGRKIDVVGRGPYIEQGVLVEVCEVKGNRIVVRALRDGASGGELS
ncbi:MAG: NfeD family protein [Planctomycetota bacterium]